MDLVHNVGGLLPQRLRGAIAGYTFTCLPMQLHAVSCGAFCSAAFALKCCLRRLPMQRHKVRGGYGSDVGALCPCMSTCCNRLGLGH